MSDDLESIAISLSTGHVFNIAGPQGDHRVFFGTIGDDPDFSNGVISRYLERFADPPDSYSGTLDGNHISTLACSSSHWLLLQFPDSRRDEVVANLETMLMETV